MEILQQDNGKKGSFYIGHEGNKAAEMTYVWAGPHRIIIDHTEVSDVLRGKNAGKQMVEQAVAFARERGLKITPLCPFANSMFKKHPDWADLL